MEIRNREIADLIPADYNPRKKSEQVIASIKASLDEYGWLAPVVVNMNPERQNIIVGGHRRLEAAKQKGDTIVPTIEVNLTLEQEKKANLRLNAQEKFDQHGLAALVAELHTLDPSNVTSLGLNEKEIGDLLYSAKYMQGKSSGILAEKFLVAPFSVLDAKSGEWQARKKLWLELIGNLSESREGTLAGGKQNTLMMYGGGVSSFDPVLTEIAFSWFLPKDGKRILDPFAGSLARGGVAAILGNEYTGIDIRKDQIEVNEKHLATIETTGSARFYTGNALDLEKIVPAGEMFDMIFTCPPYYDLEIYSNDEEDLSAKKSYSEFMVEYESIFKQATDRLNDNRFAVIVVGDIRDEKGMYRNFIRDNITMFERLGYSLYNEMIYLQALATAPHRAERNMKKRKPVKVHQNVLAFYKGDAELLRNPQLIQTHLKVLTFLKGDSAEHIPTEYKNPPDIKRDVFAALDNQPPEEEEIDDIQ